MAEPQRTSHGIGQDGRRLRARVRWAHAARLLTVLTLVLGGMWMVTAGAAQASLAGTAAVSGWKVEPTPNPAGATINELSAVSCTSGRACTAVGSHAASLSSPSFTLAERWNGARWQIQHTLQPAGAASVTLFGVSCASATACTAVGSYSTAAEPDVARAVAERWNGARWAIQPVPRPAGATSAMFLGVSCSAARACTAVGSYSTAARGLRPLAERWNGARWAIQPVPRPAGAASAEFTGVSCAAASACTAVGHPGPGGAGPLVEAWNGSRWHIQAVPLPHASAGGILASVSCTSPRACTATGANFSTTSPTLAERWNGTRWRVQPAPYPANSGTSKQAPELNAVSCASATACTASGAYAPGGHPAYFLEAWNGRSWRLVTAPHPAGFAAGALNGMSCVLARCTAVGAWSSSPVFVATLAIAG